MSGGLKRFWVQLQEKLADVPVAGLLLRSAKADLKKHSKDMAGSIAYFGMLSLFPLILGLVALASGVLKSEELRMQVMDWVNEFIPVGSDMVTQNIESLVRLRGAAGVASVIMLLWSASKMVGAMSRGINRALDLHRSHALLLSPLRNFGLIVIISVLMFASSALTPLAEMASALDLSTLGVVFTMFVKVTGGWMVGLLSTGVMIGAAYVLVPYRKPAWVDLLPGLLTATLLIEFGKRLFIYYFENVSKLDSLYGSITSFIVLMLWMYFFGRVLLFGAQVIAIHRTDRLGDREASEDATESESES